jgi:hypothetical protein
VRSGETACPFCGSSVLVRATPTRDVYPRMAAAAAVATSVAAAAACGTSESSAPRALPLAGADAQDMEAESGGTGIVGVTSMYGAPGLAPVEAMCTSAADAEAGTPDAGTADSGGAVDSGEHDG